MTGEHLFSLECFHRSVFSRLLNLCCSGSSDDEDSDSDEEVIAPALRVEDAEERDELTAEADMDIEELLKKYGLNQSALKKSDADGSDDEVDDENGEDDDDMADAPTPRSVTGTPRSFACDNADASGAEVKLEDERLQAIAASARAFAPTGHTLKTTEVKTKIPEILRATLREYQHVALDWLVSLSDKRLNGILADEMGLGKTLMTISLLAHHACENGNWGPHLIVVPTSVMLNWEIEIKKFCPAFKVLTYYGSLKERRKKRQGWSKPNSFHICITSYKLVVQDANMFRRKKWRYLILDEAHNIKNFSSQRWQVLLNFRTKRRLLLTGTPIQNNLMELWSLLHFLMPHIFGNHDEFKEWFSKPLTHMVEGAQVMNMELINRLHTVLRPFILRRLKKDVESQMPSKYEHVVPCRLSKRQRFLYDEFMLAGTTRAKLASGNLLEIINVLMQLRKVCNHPDLFEERPIYSPVEMGSLVLTYPRIVFGLSQNRVEASSCTLLLSSLQQLNTREVELCAYSNKTKPPYPALLGPVPLPNLMVNPLAFISDELAMKELSWKDERRQMIHRLNCLRAPGGQMLAPCYGSDLRAAVSISMKGEFYHHSPGLPRSWEFSSVLNEMVVSPIARLERLMDVARVFCAIHAKVRAKDPVVLRVDACRPPIAFTNAQVASAVQSAVSTAAMTLQPAIIRSQLHFPDKRLLQYDCGKLQTLAALLRQLKDGGHRVLIFTQMSKVLNILEEFLSFHHHAYVRLDGTTKIEKRQQIVERFNKDPRLFVFISSTRSGGLGINLTGADTVIFYDSDWNPAMDKQAQDRCHRIGQTRDVHIYRLVSEHTVEENILKKATQKQHLDTIVMSDGLFTEASLAKVDVRDFFAPELFEEVPVTRRAVAVGASPAVHTIPIDGPISARDWEVATSHAEDTADVAALASAKREVQIDEEDFAEAPCSKELRRCADADTAIESSTSAPPRKSPRIFSPEDESTTPVAKFDRELMHMLKPVQRLALLSLERSRVSASTAGGEARLLEDARIEAELDDWRAGQIALFRDADAQLAADEAYLKLNGNAQYFHEAPSGNSLAVYREQLVRLRLVGLSHDFLSLYGPPVPEDDILDGFIFALVDFGCESMLEAPISRQIKDREKNDKSKIRIRIKAPNPSAPPVDIRPPPPPPSRKPTKIPPANSKTAAPQTVPAGNQWTREEENVFVQCVHKYGHSSWRFVADMLNFHSVSFGRRRSPKAVNEYWVYRMHAKYQAMLQSGQISGSSFIHSNYDAPSDPPRCPGSSLYRESILQVNQPEFIEI
jgi:E1A-binding protein p400